MSPADAIEESERADGQTEERGEEGGGGEHHCAGEELHCCAGWACNTQLPPIPQMIWNSPFINIATERGDKNNAHQ